MYIIDLCHVHYSALNTVFLFLHTYADNGGVIKAVLHEGDEVQLKMKYEMILFFTTGAPREPQGTSPYPRSNTCSNTIYLPTIEMSFEKFSYYMAYGITNTAGFGRV